jgi:hypothetical protein
MRFKYLLVSAFLSIFCFCPFLFAEEKITITTYYPSPYGSYNQLQTDKLGIGDNNSDGSFTSSDVPTTTGDVWIKGNVGIGTTLTTVSPLKKLILKGLGTSTGIGLQVLDSSNTVLFTTLDNGSLVVGTTTASPVTDKLYIDNSIVLHSGGNKVIGFGWSPGNSQVLMGGYPAELRWSPTGGILQLGIDTTYRSSGSPVIPSNLVVTSTGRVGINNSAPGYTVDIYNPSDNSTWMRAYNTHSAHSIWQATGSGGYATTGQVNVFDDVNWQGGVGMQVGTFTSGRGVSIVAGGNGVLTVQPTYNSGTGWSGRVGINNYSPSVELDVNGDIKTNAGITLGGTRRTAWPTLSCRYIYSGSHYVSCNSDEYLTGGGCYWREVEDSGTDDVHGHPNGTSGSSLGGSFYCDSGDGSGTTYGICCK